MSVSKIFIFSMAGLLLAGICLDTALLLNVIVGASIVYGLLLITQGAGFVGLLYAFVAATVNHLTNVANRGQFGTPKRKTSVQKLDEI